MQPSLTDRPVLLIHGGLHGASCWAATQRCFDERHRTTLAFDLPGHGEDQTPLAEIGMNDYVHRAIDALESLGAPATVICHSMGGIVGTGLADRCPERVDLLVYVAAIVPGDGDSLEGGGNRQAGSRFEKALKPDQVGVSHRMDPDEAEYFFYHDCTAADAKAASARLCAQPLRPMRERLDLSGRGIEAVRKAYITCTNDRVLTLERQGYYASRYANTLRRSIATGHSPFLAQPRAFVDMVLSIEAEALS